MRINQPVASTYSESKERILDAAERLFHAKGLKAVTLRDIAQAVGINHTTLFHHCPGGKEALFVEVMSRAFARHAAQLRRVLLLDEPNSSPLARALSRASHWMLAQPPIDFMRMMLADMPALGSELSQKLGSQAFDAYLSPFVEAFRHAHARGEIRMISDPTILAGSFLAIVQSVHASPTQTRSDAPKARMVDEMIDVLLNGLVVGQSKTL
jgi:TetR/AcrR family transcriptional regulator, cholesterol catabolism regulator